jgi:class 3 adenylate cyclase
LYLATSSGAIIYAGADVMDALQQLRSTVPPAPGAEQSVAERRQLTLLFCDLAGSTALSARLDPEDLREVMAQYYQMALEVFKEHGGYIAEFLGDGLLVYFSWPTAREHDAERAVRAGLAAAEAISQITTPAGPLAVRVGIATEPVVVGDILNSGETRKRNVIGETPNLAARLQSQANPGEIVADETTRRLTGAMFEWVDLGASELKGLPHPVRIWRAAGKAAVASRSEALHTRRLSPLIGREEELKLLVRRWRRAVSGEGQIVLISGEAGIGKSRLIAALQEAIAATGDNCERLEWFCSPYHQDSALHPVIARLKGDSGFGHETRRRCVWPSWRHRSPLGARPRKSLASSPTCSGCQPGIVTRVSISVRSCGGSVSWVHCSGGRKRWRTRSLSISTQKGVLPHFWCWPYRC